MISKNLKCCEKVTIFSYIPRFNFSYQFSCLPKKFYLKNVNIFL